LLDLDGGRHDTLAPDPGQRIHALAERRDRVLALVGSANGVVGRWIEIGAAGGGGGKTNPKLAIGPDVVVLSPDLRHIAGTAAQGKKAVYVDLASGRAIAIPVPQEIAGRPDTSMAPRGFVDATVLALEDKAGGVVWWDADYDAKRSM